MFEPESESEAEAEVQAKKPLTFFQAYARMMGAVIALLFVFFMACSWYARKLPAEVETDRSVTLAMPQSQLWELLRHSERFPDWRPGLGTVQVTADDSDGIKAWTEDWRGETAKVRVVSLCIPDSLVLEISPSQNTFVATWSFALEPVGLDSTRLLLHAHTRLRAPLYRIAAHYGLNPAKPVDQLIESLTKTVSGAPAKKNASPADTGSR